MVPTETKTLCRLFMFPTISVVVLMGLVSMDINAQDENETCPCFSYEEVETIFLKGVGLAEDEGMTDCSTQDYSVEFNAEVVVWDMEYTLVAKARVDWFDFDPGGCEYIDTSSDPAVERNIRWPHPAPEGTARACLNIISSVIKKSDTSGKCTTYP
jgi:hypothetical protein